MPDRPRSVSRTLLLVALLAVGVLGYRYWASDERQIRRLLDGVADGVSQAEGEAGVAGLAEVAGLTTYLTPDVAVEATLRASAAAIRGAPDVVSTVGRFRAVYPVLTLSFEEVLISIDSDRTATAKAMAATEMQGRDGAREADAWHVELSLERRDGSWVIARVKAESPVR
jgi:hypothetical protein